MTSSRGYTDSNRF